MPSTAALPATLSAQLHTWQIHAEASKRLALIYQRNMNAKLLKVLERWLLEHPHAPAHAAFLDLQAQKARLLWTTPALVWFAQVGGHRAQAEQVEEVICQLHNTLEHASPPPLLYGYEEHWANYACDTIQHDLVQAGMPARLSLGYQDAEYTREQDSCNHALSLLAHVWPEAFQEFQTLIRNVVFLNGEGLRSSMLPHTFGAIYLSAQALEDEIAAFDFLIHETTHHSVTVKLAFTSFVDNPEAYAQSPLRPDPRPLLAVLHAVVVLMRVCWGLQAALPDLPADLCFSAEKRLHIYQKDLQDGITALDRSARWTEAGAMLFEHLQQDAQKLPVW